MLSFKRRLQVLAGSVIGWLASLTIPHSSPTTAKEFQGWHPNNPARSASVMAATTAAATGVRHAASALMPSPINPPEGTTLSLSVSIIPASIPTSLISHTSRRHSIHSLEGGMCMTVWDIRPCTSTSTKVRDDVTNIQPVHSSCCSTCHRFCSAAFVLVPSLISPPKILVYCQDL